LFIKTASKAVEFSIYQGFFTKTQMIFLFYGVYYPSYKSWILFFEHFEI